MENPLQTLILDVFETLGSKYGISVTQLHMERDGDIIVGNINEHLPIINPDFSFKMRNQKYISLYDIYSHIEKLSGKELRAIKIEYVDNKLKVILLENIVTQFINIDFTMMSPTDLEEYLLYM